MAEISSLTSTELKSLGFQVDGNILNELSRQVSSHLFALGELIKNSYDAKATLISIELDLSTNKLIIEDNGDGISYENAKSLFHIAKSSKKYGQKFTFLTHTGEKVTRYTQGSKGLGLLSAFKFGDIVSWNSKCKNETLLITVDKNDVVKLADINDISYPIFPGNKKENGTIITINLNSTDTEEINYIYNYFKELRNAKKLTNFFFDNYLQITLTLRNKDGYIEQNFPIKTKSTQNWKNDLSNNSLFRIEYNSLDDILTFTNNENKIFTTKFQPTNNKRNYKISFSIIAYSLKSGGKKKIDSLFHNKNNNLSPLVYINGTLFNNDQVFDPSITRQIQSSKSLPQLVGFVEIFSDDLGLQFNNERTDLVTNLFNTTLKNDIEELNKFLQAEGKKLEKNNHLFSENIISTVVDAKDEVKPTTTSTKDEVKFYTPVISLKNDIRDIYRQDYPYNIDLKDFFINASDSQGIDIPIEKIKIKVNGRISQPPFFESIDSAQNIVISYSFIDTHMCSSNGKNVEIVEFLNLSFHQETNSFNTVKDTEDLISSIGKNYILHLKGVNKLIKQLNKLWKNNLEHDMCIAASIRLLFDLTTYRYTTLTHHKFQKKGLESNVYEIIETIMNNKNEVTEIEKILGSRFTIIKNLFEDPGLFSTKVSISNLGSHTGSQHMTVDTIKDIATYAGYYAQLVDAYCRHKGLIDQ